MSLGNKENDAGVSLVCDVLYSDIAEGSLVTIVTHPNEAFQQLSPGIEAPLRNL